jgi:RHS repeat-associated protein
VRRAFASTSSANAYSYDPYGNPMQTTAPVTDFGYAGMFYDADSGLYLTPYRAYDPVAGRWLSRDPVGEGGDPGANLYAYVGGNPIEFADPLGLCGSPFGNLFSNLLSGLAGQILLTELLGGGPLDPFADAAVLAELAGAELAGAELAGAELAAEGAGGALVPMADAASTRGPSAPSPGMKSAGTPDWWAAPTT